MSGDNASGADNQQETAIPRTRLEPAWVVGFVDGEGCFSVSVHNNPHVRRTRGWQLQPTFQVYQHDQHRAVLEELVRFFGCGRIRSKGPRSSVSTFAVDSLDKLATSIVPFFEQHQLRIKATDFDLFAEIVRSMLRKEHLERAGFERLARLAYAMNAQGKQRARSIDEVLAGSSETVRQALFEQVKIQSELHGDMQS